MIKECVNDICVRERHKSAGRIKGSEDNKRGSTLEPLNPRHLEPFEN
jgi:hypothetical protein